MFITRRTTIRKQFVYIRIWTHIIVSIDPTRNNILLFLQRFIQVISVQVNLIQEPTSQRSIFVSRSVRDKKVQSGFLFHFWGYLAVFKKKQQDRGSMMLRGAIADPQIPNPSPKAEGSRWNIGYLKIRIRSHWYIMMGLSTGYRKGSVEIDICDLPRSL